MGAASGPRPEPCGHGHSVQFYETGDFLAQHVAAYLAGSLHEAGTAIVVATPEHRARFESALRQLGFDTPTLRDAGRLAVLDARQTLQAFMRAGTPDPGLFRTVIESVMDALPDRSGPIRVYGEMVAVLWADGDVASALALEDLWNEVATERAFELLCAYPIGAFDEPATAAAFQRICRQHSEVIPSEGYSSVPAHDESTRSRVVAELQREVRSLRRSLEQGGALPAGSPTSSAPAAAGPEPAVVRCAELLRHGDHQGVEALLADLTEGGCSVVTALSQVVTPALYLIGELWQQGRITVADEHLATATCERVIAGLYPAILTHRPRSRERVLVAAAEGEAHALGARMLSDVLDGRGFDVIHLGANVPADSLALAVGRHEPDLVALSVTREAAADGLGRCIAAAQQARPGVLILLGGQGLSPVWERLGYPVCHSLEEAPTRVEALLRERPPMPLPTAAPNHLPDLVAAAGGDTPGLAERFTSITTDIGTLAREQALRAHEFGFLAYRDPLTGLPNRRAFEDAVTRAAELGREALVLMLDVDNFKRINDTFGHDAGDQVLRDVARVLVESIRPDDLAARIGGDEFALLVSSAHGTDVPGLADRIRSQVQAALAPAGATVSIGGAPLGADRGLSVSVADRFLYQAKAAGRNTVALPARSIQDRPPILPR